MRRSHWLRNWHRITYNISIANYIACISDGDTGANVLKIVKFCVAVARESTRMINRLIYAYSQQSFAHFVTEDVAPALKPPLTLTAVHILTAPHTYVTYWLENQKPIEIVAIATLIETDSKAKHFYRICYIIICEPERGEYWTHTHTHTLEVMGNGHKWQKWFYFRTRHIGTSNREMSSHDGIYN